MEEEVLKIIQNYIDQHCTEERFLDDQGSASKEIAEHFMQFVGWMFINSEFIRFVSDDTYFIKYPNKYKLQGGVYSFSELYSYWQEHVKKSILTDVDLKEIDKAREERFAK